MFLLSGHSLTPARKVPIESMTMSLSERGSTATIAPTDMTGIGVNSWFRSESNPGKNTVWRVKSLGTSFNENVQTVQLEHVVNALKDRLLFGEITAETITGRKGATECTAAQAARYILNQSDDWVLGSIDFSETQPYKFDGDSLFDALETVTKTLDDAMWTYNMTVYPFKLNIVQKPADVDSEMRAARNITAISRTVDRSGMYTRFYPIGKDDLHISGDYKSRNESTYGVISRTETDTSLETKSALTRWANERLKRHAQPVVTVEVEGLELADATGEAMDRFNIGRICRIPLPDYGTTITERITALNYPDVVHTPQSVRVTLSNATEDVTHLSLTEILTETAKRSAGGGRGAARQAKEDHAWFEDTDTRVSMVVGTRDGKNYIKAGEITLAINKSTGESEAIIDAHHVWIGNKDSVTVINGKCELKDVSADYISAKIAEIPTLRGIAASFTGNVSTKSSVISPYYYLGTGGAELGSGVQYVRINGPTGNTYKLQYKTYRNSSWQDAGSFSRAVTSWSMGWSGGRFTATANPQGSSAWTEILQGAAEWDGRTVTIPIRAYDSDNPGYEYGTGRSVTATYTASKSDITMTRSGRSGSQPSADATITAINVTQSGWYVFTVTACGTSKTFRMQITV